MKASNRRFYVLLSSVGVRRSAAGCWRNRRTYSSLDFRVCTRLETLDMVTWLTCARGESSGRTIARRQAWRSLACRAPTAVGSRYATILAVNKTNLTHRLDRTSFYKSTSKVKDTPRCFCPPDFCMSVCLSVRPSVCVSCFAVVLQFKRRRKMRTVKRLWSKRFQYEEGWTYFIKICLQRLELSCR